VWHSIHVFHLKVDKYKYLTITNKVRIKDILTIIIYDSDNMFSNSSNPVWRKTLSFLLSIEIINYVLHKLEKFCRSTSRVLVQSKIHMKKTMFNVL
jgi:hypothetical protein